MEKILKKKTKFLKANLLDLIVYDFDGVMTDNRVITMQDGSEAVIVNRADGWGVRQIRRLGIPQIILSTECNLVVKARGEKLGIEVISGCDDKKNALIRYCRNKNYNLSKVLYIGNDVNDLEAMRAVGFPMAPADAHVQIKKVAVIILQSKGGEGVVKELAENYIEARKGE